jgi:hypothetical protein
MPRYEGGERRFRAIVQEALEQLLIRQQAGCLPGGQRVQVAQEIGLSCAHGIFR